jgi:hypothetical protein
MFRSLHFSRRFRLVDLLLSHSDGCPKTVKRPLFWPIAIILTMSLFLLPTIGFV